MLSNETYKELYQAIAVRRSVRTYNGQPMEPESMKALKKFMSEIPSLPLEGTRNGSTTGNFDIKICGLNTAEPVKLGSYGVIRRAPSFIALTAPTTDSEEEAALMATGAAFKAEFMVLWLAANGLGSCWMSGTVNRKKLAASLGISDSDNILACIPFGYATGKATMLERVMASFVHARSRKPFDELFKVDEDSGKGLKEPDRESEFYAAETRRIFEAVRLAPSGCNRQPWRGWVDSEGNPVLYFDNKTPDMNALDRGIALAHAYIAAMTGNGKE